jgi:hypothetical protein
MKSGAVATWLRAENRKEARRPEKVSRSRALTMWSGPRDRARWIAWTNTLSAS